MSLHFSILKALYRNKYPARLDICIQGFRYGGRDNFAREFLDGCSTSAELWLVEGVVGLEEEKRDTCGCRKGLIENNLDPA